MELFDGASDYGTYGVASLADIKGKTQFDILAVMNNKLQMYLANVGDRM